jgi:dihydroorotate dehydrogenase
LSLISGNSTYCWIVECHPFPIPKIGDTDMIRSMDGFTFASALDLNMGYHHIKLDADAQNLCTIVFPWWKYKYKRLPMGIKIAPDIFQNIMSNLVQNIEYVKTYLDDLLILTNRCFKDHLLKLELVQARLSTNEFPVWEWTFPDLCSLQNK